MAARLEAPRAGVRPVTVSAPARRAGVAWPRLPEVAELATIGAGYLGYALVRLAIHADRHTAFAHAAQLWRAERRMHLRIEPWLNGLAAARPALAEAAGYYYGLLHFLVTPLVLAWLYWRRPAAFGRLLGQPLPAGCSRRARRHGPGHARRQPARPSGGGSPCPPC
jgi:PAP2 superfamily